MRRALLITILIAACNPVGFDDIRNQAPIATLPPNDGYPVRAFGRVMSAWSASLALAGHSPEPISRVVASAGGDTPFAVFAIFDAGSITLGPPVYDGCDDQFPCTAGAGAAFAGLTHWNARQACLAIPAMDTGEILIRCEDDVSVFERVAGPAGIRFGASAVSLGDHAVGLALFGAPDGAGAVYRLTNGAAPTALDLTGANGGELGTALAAQAMDADTILMAASAPMMNRVVVATIDAAPFATVVRACPSGSAGYGGALAIGDLDGDSRPDLAITTASGDIELYDGATLPPTGTCATPWAPAATISCVDAMQAPCMGAGFGAALAIGDVNADGHGDLIVGAPMATVNGAAAAGAIWVLSGASSFSSVGDDRQVLTHSQPSAGAHLGTSVAVVQGQGRMEIAAGAPDVDRVYVFFCSGLSGDTPLTTMHPRCQPM